MQLFNSTENPSPNIIKLCDALKTMPPTSVEAERAFSAAGLFVTKLRTRLSDKNIVNVRTCQRWFSKFRSGDLSLQESDRSGRPSKIANDVLRSMLENNPHLTSREIAEEFGIHHTTVGERSH
ncbi:histone-lysine N-methyltransferase SETMAR [Trichonephila clavipes]|nr:histone-lysine N-methyltransferase SETMAR [Trichonephila clavipes]